MIKFTKLQIFSHLKTKEKNVKIKSKYISKRITVICGHTLYLLFSFSVSKRGKSELYFPSEPAVKRSTEIPRG